MNGHEIIESYVVDVVRQLPRDKRADIADELKSQLEDELRAGGGANEAAALGLVRRFGRPAEVALRYHTPYTVIDPADTRSFVITAVVGVLLAPNTNARLPLATDALTSLLAALAWLGVLVLCFAAKSWAVRRWPGALTWQPSPVRGDGTTLLAQLGMVVLIAALGVLYWMPGPILSFLSGGRIDAGALIYSEDFVSPLRIVWFPILLAVLAGLHLQAGFARRWTRVTRVLEICFRICAGLQLGWHAAYGNVFAYPAIDHDGRIALQLVGAVMIITAGIDAYREWNRVPLSTLHPPRAAAA